jgi:hypothetical protein
VFGLRRSMTVALAAVGVLVATATVAYGYWTQTGTGTGRVTVAADGKPLVIAQTEVTNLVPGVVADIVGTITNPNAFSVGLGYHYPTATATVDAAHCRCVFATNFVLTQPSYYESDVVPAKGTVRFGGGTIQLLDLPKVDQSACRGAVVTLTYRF